MKGDFADVLYTNLHIYILDVDIFYCIIYYKIHNYVYYNIQQAGGVPVMVIG